jgi:hypothetical protein
MPLIQSRRWSWIRPLVAVGGLAAFVGGVLALFLTDEPGRSSFLLAIGILLLIVATVGERLQLESFEVLGAQIKIRDIVKGRVELAQRAGPQHDDRGRAATAASQARTLQTLRGLYDLYQYIRSTERVSNQRTAALDHIAIRMQNAAREAHFDPAEVSTWFHDGTDPLRVVALNIMLVHDECRDFLAVLKTLDDPRNLFEQFYGLRLARAMAAELDPIERRILADAIRRAQGRRRFRRDKPLLNSSNSLLTQLEP